MTIPESPGELLTNLCSNAQSLVLVAPYIKANALGRVLAQVDSATSIICVTRWNPGDLAMGASDAECRRLVIDRGGSFRLHPTLHAKFYRADDVVLIGSANLTASALGWSRQPNLEILCRAGDDFDSQTFEQELMNGAREISDGEFLRWEAISKLTSVGERSTAEDQPSLDTWRPATRDPIHLVLSYQGREDAIASFDEQRAARRDLQSLLIPPGLSNEEVRTWATTCLLAAPFTNSVIQLTGTSDATASYRLLARTYGLSMTQARRDMETVQNWLAALAPETLTDTP